MYSDNLTEIKEAISPACPNPINEDEKPKKAKEKRKDKYPTALKHRKKIEMLFFHFSNFLKILEK